MPNPELQQIVVRGVGEQRGQVWEFDAVAQAVHFSFQTDGGDKEATWNLDDAGRHNDALPNPGSLVTIYDDQGPIWDGFFARFEGEPWTDGAELSYVAEGMSARAGLTENQGELIFKKGTNFGSAFQYATGPIGGYVNAEPSTISPVAFALTFQADSPDFNHHTPQDIYKAICSFASDLLPPFHWHIRCDRQHPGAAPYLEVYLYDATPKYFVSLGDGVLLKTKTDIHRVVNRVCVKWTKQNLGTDLPTSVEEETVQDNDSIAALGGLIIDRTVDATNDLFDAASARGLGHRLLRDFAALRPTGGSMTLDYGIVVRDIQGQQVPLWRIYPGVVIQVIDQAVSDRPFFGDSYPIVGVEWDEGERQCALALGELNTLDRQVLHIVQMNQTALTRNAEGVLGTIKNEQKNQPGGVAGLNHQGDSGKLDPAVIPHPLALPVKFDVICGLPVATVDSVLSIGKFSIPVSFDFNILGWRMVSDGSGSVLVNIRQGAFDSFPAFDTGFTTTMFSQQRHDQTFDAPLPVAAGSVLQFLPDMDSSPSLPDSSYLSIELFCERIV